MLRPYAGSNTEAFFAGTEPVVPQLSTVGAPAREVAVDPKRIADRIVGIIADGRMTPAIIDAVAFWVASMVRGTEAEKSMMRFANSVRSSIKESRRAEKSGVPSVVLEAAQPRSEAFQAAERLSRALAGDPDAMYEMGLSRWHKGDRDGARAWMQQAHHGGSHQASKALKKIDRVGGP